MAATTNGFIKVPGDRVAIQGDACGPPHNSSLWRSHPRPVSCPYLGMIAAGSCLGQWGSLQRGSSIPILLCYPPSRYLNKALSGSGCAISVRLSLPSPLQPLPLKGHSCFPGRSRLSSREQLVYRIAALMWFFFLLRTLQEHYSVYVLRSVLESTGKLILARRAEEFPN